MLPNKRLALILGLTLGMVMNTAYAQSCKSNMQNKWPDSRYTAHSNGTVTDKTTGLIWKKCGEGQETNNSCTGSASDHTWQTALQAASNSTFAGYTDWRLPNIKELHSLVASNCWLPSINVTLFPNTPSNRYWSSTPDSSNSSNAWTINTYVGRVLTYGRNSAVNSKVRLVRDG